MYEMLQDTSSTTSERLREKDCSGCEFNQIPGEMGDPMMDAQVCQAAIEAVERQTGARVSCGLAGASIVFVLDAQEVQNA